MPNQTEPTPLAAHVMNKMKEYSKSVTWAGINKMGGATGWYEQIIDAATIQNDEKIVETCLEVLKQCFEDKLVHPKIARVVFSMLEKFSVDRSLLSEPLGVDLEKHLFGGDVLQAEQLASLRERLQESQAERQLQVEQLASERGRLEESQAERQLQAEQLASERAGRKREQKQYIRNIENFAERHNSSPVIPHTIMVKDSSASQDLNSVTSRPGLSITKLQMAAGILVLSVTAILLSTLVYRTTCKREDSKQLVNHKNAHRKASTKWKTYFSIGFITTAITAINGFALEYILNGSASFLGRGVARLLEGKMKGFLGNSFFGGMLGLSLSALFVRVSIIRSNQRSASPQNSGNVAQINNLRRDADRERRMRIAKEQENKQLKETVDDEKKKNTSLVRALKTARKKQSPAPTPFSQTLGTLHRDKVANHGASGDQDAQHQCVDLVRKNN